MRRFPQAAGLAVFVVTIPLLAGCVAEDDDGDAQPAFVAFDDDIITAGVDWWEDFSTRWIKRDAYLPDNDDVRTYLAAEMEALGFDVEVRAYPSRLQGNDLPDAEPVWVQALVATRPGMTMPQQRIGLVSHYDTQTLTVEGAYDDASGVAAQYTICRGLTEVELDRTLACIFFDGEEQGLVASDRYVQDVVVEDDEPYRYDFVVGYDMTGINWPGHDWKMYLMTGGEDHVPMLGDFARRVMHDELGYPVTGVAVLDEHDRNSDERRFRDVGVPIFRFAGGRHASDYPQYHRPGDSVEYVYDFVGGRPNFESGFGTIVEASHRLVQELDRTNLAAIVDTYG